APSAGAAVSLPTHSQLVDWAQLRWDQHRQRILPPSTQETALVSHHASTGHHATTAVGSPSSPRGATVRASDVLDPQAPTVIIAADRGYQPPATADFAGALAARLEVPVLAEPSSGVREETWYCPHQQQVLTRWGGQVRQAIVVGTPTLSRPVGRLLARPDVRVIVLATTSDPVRPWPDLFGNAHWVGPDLEWDVEFAPQVRDWGRELLARARGLTAGIEAAPTAGLGVARAVWDSVEPDQILLAGASNAIRYLDLAAPRPARAQVFANRGQAGIDGTIATALGLHAGSGKAVRVLLGDLTAIHDVGSLALPSGAEADVDLVVIDDSGGQIFRTLEHGQAASESHYQQLFAMGVNVDYRALAAAFGWEFAELVWHEGGAGELAQILTQYRGGRRLVRVSCDHSQVGEQLRAVIAGG
ncbi:MAG: hypothetical protein Q4P06_07025, partial [Actinomycetaceae bacterium]|nr:hypothetical protein [Actinomycetaceae bacterium]